MLPPGEGSGSPVRQVIRCLIQSEKKENAAINFTVIYNVLGYSGKLPSALAPIEM